MYSNIITLSIDPGHSVNCDASFFFFLQFWYIGQHPIFFKGGGGGVGEVSEITLCKMAKTWQ